MEFLKLVRRRSFISEVVYTVLNILLAIALLLVIRYTDSILLALLVVLVSKWRVFAVRPRYWFANLRSNLVDFIVSVGVVIHMYTINTSDIPESRQLIVLGILTALYIAWLLFLKPRSRRSLVALQAGVAVLIGTSALFVVSFNWPVSLVVLGMWLIGYGTAHHVLGTYDDETHSLFIALAWGTVMAEIGWVAYHWAIAYTLPFVSSLSIPQVTILTVLAGFVAYKAYDSFYHHQKLRMADILLPLLFSVSVMLILLLFFNQVGTAI